MRCLGLHIELEYPNVTNVGQVMDTLFQKFKGWCQIATHNLFNEKVYERMIKIKERNLWENQDTARTDKITSVVSLHQDDISTIVNGRSNYPIGKRSFNWCFIPSIIKKSWSNIGLSPCNMSALNNKKVRHKIGQRESVTDGGKTSNVIIKLNEDYGSIKIKLKEEGFKHKIFDVDIHMYIKQRTKR